MDDMTTARSLRLKGYGPSEVRLLVAKGELKRVRRGVYRRPDPEGDQAPASVELEHRRQVAATVPLVSPEAVLSHGTAGVLHDLPVWPDALTYVHLTRSGVGGGRRRTNTRTHVAPLAPHEVASVGGFAVTAVGRTVVDLARTRSYDQGVAAADRALAAGTSLRELEVAVGRARGWPGAPRARRVVAFASPLAESPGESISRVRIDEHGLPTPVPQLVVLDPGGAFVARSDFGWPELKTIGEFDGRVKYGRLLRSGETSADAVYREKLREDLIRDLGWQVVRWTWADLYDFGPVAIRLRRAFARSL